MIISARSARIAIAGLLLLALAVPVVAAAPGRSLSPSPVAPAAAPVAPVRATVIQPAAIPVSPAPVLDLAASAALPACRYADVTTKYTSTASWPLTLVDTIYRVSSSYVPPLTSVSRAGFGGGFSVRPEVIADLSALRIAAAKAGGALGIVSAYRSYSTQVSTFNYWVSVGGYSAALLSSARAGHSEHQLGTAIDFNSAGGTAPWNLNDWATTSAGAWMKANAWKYGFVNSYPKGLSPSVTCYQYEPWHYRYVGRTEAAAIHASGLTPRAWLWAHQ